MWSVLSDWWSAVVNFFILWLMLGGFWFAMRSLKWKYEPGSKQRDVGMLRTGVGIARVFLGR